MQKGKSSWEQLPRKSRWFAKRADWFLCSHRVASRRGHFLWRTNLRCPHLRGGINPFGAQAGHSHRQLRGRFGAENTHQAGRRSQRYYYHPEGIGSIFPDNRHGCSPLVSLTFPQSFPRIHQLGTLYSSSPSFPCSRLRSNTRTGADRCYTRRCPCSRRSHRIGVGPCCSCPSSIWRSAQGQSFRRTWPAGNAQVETNLYLGNICWTYFLIWSSAVLSINIHQSSGPIKQIVLRKKIRNIRKM